MGNSEIIVLNKDQKEVVDRRSKDAFFAITQLNDWVQSDSLSEEMREMLLCLATSYLSDIKKEVGFTGEEPDHIKEMTRQLNQNLHDRIQELEHMVNSQNSILTVKQQLKSIDEKINLWWDEEGFNYVQDITFTGGGNIKVIFGFMLDNVALRYSTTPHSDKEVLNDKIQKFVDQGFILAKKNYGNEKDLIDCEQNRNLLIQMIKTAFPSARILSFKNRIYMTDGPDKDKYVLRDLEVNIYDYADIENLCSLSCVDQTN
jgi:hypothetical protein